MTPPNERPEAMSSPTPPSPMISTSVMIQLGRVEDNKMVNMQLTNEKLIDRGVKMLMEKLRRNDYEKTKELLLKYGSVKKAVDAGSK